MNTYFRITAYSPALNVSFIIDCIDKHEEIWEFSAELVAKKCKILAVSNGDTFNDGNIPKASPQNERYILRACEYGKVELQNGVISIRGRYYTPNMR